MSTMKLRLQEALEDGCIWREKMERLGLVKMPSQSTQPTPKPAAVLGRPRSSISEKDRLLAKYKRKCDLRNERMIIRNQSLEPIILEALKPGNALTLSELGKHANISIQQVNSVIEYLRDKGVIYSERVCDALWVVLVGNPIPVDEIKRKEKEKRNKRSENRMVVDSAAKDRTSKWIRNFNSHEAVDAWKTLEKV